MHDEMELRLQELEHPDHLDPTLSVRQLTMMVAVTILLPLVMIIVAWGWTA